MAHQRLQRVMYGAAMACVGGLVAVGGCARPSAYQRVFKDQPPHHNSQLFSVASELCWTATTRAALSLNFAIDQQEKDHGSFQASRYFTEGKRTTSIVLKVTLQPEGQAQTRVFANAVQTTKEVFTRSHTRFFLWLIPLPGGGGTEASRVIEGEATVEDQLFYDAFFRAIEQEVHTLTGSVG